METRRTILRRFRREDADAVFDFNSRDEVLRWTGDRKLETRNDAVQIIEQIWLNDYERIGYGRLAVVHRQDDRVIGFAGLKYLVDAGLTDIGYRLLPEYWGQGLATEVAQPLVRHGFDDLGLSRIVGFVLPDNVASIRVLLKSGFVFQRFAPYPGEELMVNWYVVEPLSCP